MKVDVRFPAAMVPVEFSYATHNSCLECDLILNLCPLVTLSFFDLIFTIHV